MRAQVVAEVRRRAARRLADLGAWRAASAAAIRREVDFGRHVLWTGPFLAAGAALHLTLRADPPPELLVPLAAVACFAAVALRAAPRAGVAALLAAALALGTLAADVAVRIAAQPMLTEPHGSQNLLVRVLRVDARAERSPRVLVEVLRIEGYGPDAAPRRLLLFGRVLDGLRVGAGLEVRARLEPVPRPTHPGAYDPSFHAFFAGVGGYGFVSARPRPAAVPEPDVRQGVMIAVERWRTSLTERIVERLGPQLGPVAAALVTGQRTAIPEDVLRDFSASGLMHVLSISGLHMALVAGGMFWLFRLGLAAAPALALRLPVKKLAAGLALGVATFYWIASGAEVATTRSYIMIVVVFAAILIDRPAISMRNLVVAAAVLVALEPEAVLSASFQMSFGATAALVAAYERRLFPKLAHPEQPVSIRLLARAGELAVATAIVSLVCEAAILPFVLHHFHRVTWFGLIGNVLAFAIIDFLVMPAALLTLFLAPLGLGGWAIDLLGFGVARMHDVARFVASLPGAVSVVRGFGTGPMLLAALGVAWLCLWRTWLAAFGALPYVAAFLLWSFERPPDLRISATGDVVAARGDRARWVVDAVRPDPFVVRRWLEADADPRLPADPGLTEGRACDEAGCTVRLAVGALLALPRSPAAFAEDCARADLVVARGPAPAACPRPRLVLGRAEIGRSHGLDLRWNGGAPIVRTVAESCGRRPWCPDPDSPARPRWFAPRVSTPPAQ